jgi:lipoprotein-releasing system ATP-binding protein
MVNTDEVSVRVEDLKKTFQTGDTSLTVLEHLNLIVKKGEIVTIVGRSGTGKSTLLNLIGGLDKPTEGIINIKGIQIENSDETALSEFRNKYVGFIFQFHHLLPEFTVLENVMMPHLIGSTSDRSVHEKSLELLSSLEIIEKKDAKPNKLSGGESQRVAIARALINDPEIILADEPTGNLDLETAEIIKALLFDIVKKYGHTMIIVTHNNTIVKDADSVYQLKYGALNNLIDNII